uniref:hAT-like transposase RNase-H fold domain-containing protein n=1 Tax=Arundo donax TaxID=35708 RepID=A0A0A9GL37_ARUDO
MGKSMSRYGGHCNFPKCKTKYRGEGNHGTTGFRNHLRSAHSIVEGQQQLKVGKDHGKDITIVEPYRYDQEANVKKLYLAIIIHEYPFNIVEHDYFVLVVACFLDPRYKKKLIEFYMRKFYGQSYQVHLEEVISVIRKLYQFYASTSTSSSTKAKAKVNERAPVFRGGKNVDLERFLYDDGGTNGDGSNEL